MMSGTVPISPAPGRAGESRLPALSVGGPGGTCPVHTRPRGSSIRRISDGGGGKSLKERLNRPVRSPQTLNRGEAGASAVGLGYGGSGQPHQHDPQQTRNGRRQTRRDPIVAIVAPPAPIVEVRPA